MAHIIKAGSWYEKRKPLKGELDLEQLISSNTPSASYALRVATIASTATITPNVSNYDMLTVTALAEASVITNPIGTPTEGFMFIIRIKDNGTARALSFDTLYRLMGPSSLPTTTVLGKTMYIVGVYNETDVKWDVVNVIQET